MEPSWLDPLRGAFSRRGAIRFGLGLMWHKLKHRLLGAPWPTEPDHLLIREGELRAWLAPRFRLRRRKWIGRYLTYDLALAH
jgi:hypothetical protein